MSKDAQGNEIADVNSENEQDSSQDLAQAEQAEATSLKREEAQVMIDEAVAKAIEQGKQLGRKELQSQQERNKAEAVRLQRIAESTKRRLEGTRNRIATENPELYQEFEIADLKAEKLERDQYEKEEQSRLQQEEFHSQFVGSLNEHLEEQGIAKDNPKIDWGEGAAGYVEAQKRFLASVAKIVKEEKSSLVQAQKTLEARLVKLEKIAGGEADENEANSVDTTTSGGAVSVSDTDFLTKFGNGDLPFTKENKTRYTKIINS